MTLKLLAIPKRGDNIMEVKLKSNIDLEQETILFKNNYQYLLERESSIRKRYGKEEITYLVYAQIEYKLHYNNKKVVCYLLVEKDPINLSDSILFSFENKKEFFEIVSTEKSIDWIQEDWEYKAPYPNYLKEEYGKFLPIGELSGYNQIVSNIDTIARIATLKYDNDWLETLIQSIDTEIKAD
ncbi:hypothetical protein ACVU02_000582 [Listeria monocytogenes]